MNRRLWRSVLVAALICLLLSVVVVIAQESSPESLINAPTPKNNRLGSQSTAVSMDYTYTTVITVTSASDPDDKKSRVCYRDDIPTKVVASPCTLRRALVEATALSDYEPSAEPILVKFNIPTTDDGYDAGLGVWTIELYATTDLHALPRMEGNQIIVDGDTQGEIGGRTAGPKIIIQGPGAGNKDGMVIEGDDNIIRGLAFQSFETTLYINGDDNLVEDNWFGLADDGEDIHIRNELQPGDGSGSTGIDFTGGLYGTMGNTVHNNVFAGLIGVAANIEGRENVFTANRIGTVADGTVPLQGPFTQHPCLDDVWLGGSGISLDGRDHQIGGPDEADGNLFAGLYLELFSMSTQPPAIKVISSGQGYLIQNNVIGLDASQNTIGVCGRGMEFSSGPEAMQVISNTIVESNLSAIVMNHWTLNGNTLRGNIIKRVTQWPGEQGDNTFPEDAIAYGAQVPDALRNFEPAHVTSVNGTSVSGTNGEGSPCPLCTVELFLDDTDTITETHQSLAVVTADANGDWTATLPTPLADGQGLRTMSTVPDNWTIQDLDQGSTSNLSMLYVGEHKLFLPLVLR